MGRTKLICPPLENSRIVHHGRVIPWRSQKTGPGPSLTGPAPQAAEAEEEEQWSFPSVALTKLEKKKIVAEVMRIAVEAVFSTHVYQFGGRYYHQTEGGPIGLGDTGTIARVVMADWDVQLLNILLENGVSWEVVCGMQVCG